MCSGLAATRAFKASQLEIISNIGAIFEFNPVFCQSSLLFEGSGDGTTGTLLDVFALRDVGNASAHAAAVVGTSAEEISGSS